MKKSVVMLAVAVMMLGTMGVAFADASWGPAAIYADLTQITEEEAYALKVEKDMTFGELAQEEGVYDEFKAAALAGKEEMLDQLVKDGKITQEKADEVLAAMEACDGDSQGLLKGTGLFGQRNGNGRGAGNGQSNGARVGNGEGFGGGAQNRGSNGLRVMDGSCIED
ncbi:MAG TPA: hypothetical protein PKD08_02665 [Gudongella oleilytica]|nr:hypothetical protein [Gudongella oleilytica]